MNSEPLRTCAEDGDKRVPPQSYSRETRSGRAPRAAGSMTIDVQLADAGQKLRPLPRIPISPVTNSAPPAPPQRFPRSLKSSRYPPAPKSAPPVPPQQFSRGPSSRPLPSPPHSGVTACSTPPTTPLMPCFRGSGKESTTPELPTPRTAHRKRVNKLRRHLGESVQVVFDRPDKVDVLAGLRRPRNGDVCPVIDVAVESVLETHSSNDSETSSESESDERPDYFFRPSGVPSQKWMRERGKARWTEDDFTKVLQDLRAL
ncbi:hypothetical protein B0H12DRAFT_1066072 [Mycena haematopus]|nr:hypothetical protein B0H12DRAFT_1066072 [Mycena haematopus]